MSEREVELSGDMAFIETLVCGCTETDCPRRALVRQQAARLADAEARAEARALREAADQLDRDGMKRLGAHTVKQWLRARADHIEETR